MCPWPSLQSEGFSPTLRLDFNRSEGKGGQLYPCEPALRAWALYLGLADPSPWPSHHFLPDCGTVSPRGLPYPSPHPTWLTSLPCPQTICGSLVPQRGSLEIGKKEGLCSQGMWVHIMAPAQTNGVTSPSPSTLPCLTFSICKMEQEWCLLHRVMGRVHVLTPHGERLGQCQLVILSITNTGERSSPSSSSGRGRGVLGPPRPTCTAPISLFPSGPEDGCPHHYNVTSRLLLRALHIAVGTTKLCQWDRNSGCSQRPCQGPFEGHPVCRPFSSPSQPYEVGTVLFPVDRWGNQGTKRSRVTQLAQEEAGLKPRHPGSGAYGLNHQTTRPLCSLNIGLAHSRCSVNANVPQV